MFLQRDIFFILTTPSFLFWGCPALRAGRAMRGLATRSAHRFFRFAQKARSGLRPPPTIPQPAAALPPVGPK
ncbi:hypothetical protein SGRA_0136 [Saprospira grandis str. Lewin]|uniref:Uncharacterized protein n=1 Tax=Saprospira grandis (strain Lewin) TaxID=984262 RepID=H6L508_SAPGL|nr:hypothetical protein SGRA_0136 [Saprospira grandis str. Lewin]